MPCPPSSGGHVAPLLISLAFGYAVLVLAKRETRPLNRIGKFIGWLIIAVSFIGLLCSAVCGLYRFCPRYRMARGNSAVSCPFGGPRRACFAPDKTSLPDDDGDEKTK